MRRHVLANSVTWPFQGPVIIYVEAGGGGQSYFRLDRGGGLNVFVKEFSGVSSLIVRYILRGVHWPRWVKQLNSTVEHKKYMINCTNFCQSCFLLISIITILYNLFICIRQKFCLHSKLHCYFNFQLIENPDLFALIFGLAEFSFNKMLVTSISQEKHDETTRKKSFHNCRKII